MTPKPKAPRWLTEAFRDGVDERRDWESIPMLKRGVHTGLGCSGACWLAQYDPARQPCNGPLERFHFIPRQRVENALDALLPAPYEVEAVGAAYEGHAEFLTFLFAEDRRDVILLAAWDPRNGGVGCEHHHRRFDGHATSPRAPKIVIPARTLPDHVADYARDYDFHRAGWFYERFPAL